MALSHNRVNCGDRCQPHISVTGDEPTGFEKNPTSAARTQ